MPGEVRLEPIVALTDAPTADENPAIGSGPVGGLTGRTSRGVLFIDLFFLPDDLRGYGLGRRLLQLAEEEARQRGCISAVLSTLLSRRGATRTIRDRLLRGAVGFAVFLGACATANTPQQDLAYERWGKCNAPFVQLQWIDLDGRITFRYSTEGGRQDVLRCLADAGRGGPPLPDAVGMRPPSGP
jgi:GNAT superfamily N-acetyltransferase